MALSRNEVNSVSHQYFADLIIQQVYDSTIVLDKLQKSNQIKFSGGTKLQVPIRYQKLLDAEMVDPDAARVTMIKDTRNSIELDWKFAKADVAMSWEERVFNGEAGRIIDLMADKAEEGSQDLSELISTQFHQLFTSKGSYDMDGFFSAVRASSTSYGDIDQDDISSWNAGLYDTSTTTLAMYGSGSIDEGLRACHFRTFPDLMFTTLALASIYASKLQPGERRSPEDGKAGSIDHYFNKVPIIADPAANDSTWMFVNTEFMHFYVHNDNAFTVDPWMDDPDRLKALRALITVVGNFVFTRRKSFGAYTALVS